MSALDLYVAAMFHLGLIPAVAYPLLYNRWAKWRDNRVGRALMWKARALAALFAVSVFTYWWVWPFLQALYAAVLTGVTVALYRQVTVLVAVFRQKGEPKRE